MTNGIPNFEIQFSEHLPFYNHFPSWNQTRTSLIRAQNQCIHRHASMGNSSNTLITTDLLVAEVRSIRSSLSDRDRRLFNHAKFAVAEEIESLDNCELFIDFEDREGITIQTNVNPSGRIFVGYDENDRPKYVWERRGFWRAARRYFLDTFYKLLNIVRDSLPAIGTVCSLKAITSR